MVHLPGITWDPRNPHILHPGLQQALRHRDMPLLHRRVQGTAAAAAAAIDPGAALDELTDHLQVTLVGGHVQRGTAAIGGFVGICTS